MAHHEARVFIEMQPRYPLPACHLLPLTASTMLGLRNGMPPCCGMWEGGWRGEVHRDVSKPLSVYLASVPCMHEMQYAK